MNMMATTLPLREDAEFAERDNYTNSVLQRGELLAALSRLLDADRALQGAGAAAVLVVGVDQLATLRRTLGFTVADDVAQRIGERLLEAAPRTAVVGRVGDDEFALVLASTRSARDAGALARRLIDVVEAPVRIGADDLRLVPTIGVSQFPEDGRQPDVLLTRARAAMRHAVERGLRPVEFFRDSIGQVNLRRLQLEAQLRAAIDRDEFLVHYQPRCRLADRQVVGVEALLRWNHPERGLLPAAEFLDVAVDSGLITPIGESVLRRACADAARWPVPVDVAVNLSVHEYRGARLESMIDRALADSGLDPARLQVELTEATLGRGDETDVALVRLTALRERGVRLVLDNFGAGAGSLDLLRRCRPDFVKISSLFVAGMGNDADAMAIVGAIAALARRFGATVVAEGIESGEQLQAVQEVGCTQGQGYLLGGAVAAPAVGKLLGAVGAPAA